MGWVWAGVGTYVVGVRSDIQVGCDSEQYNSLLRLRTDQQATLVSTALKIYFAHVVYVPY